MNKFKITQILKWICTPILLIMCGIILSIIYFFNSDINPNIRSFDHNSSSIYVENGVVKGTINADADYLSLITVRFANTEELSGESQFRIKNILDKDWYQIATISASNYNVYPLYVFGFPTIKNSANQRYVFEISMSEGAGSSLKLSNKFPILTSQYQYPKSILLENKALLIKFIVKKLSYYIFGESALKVFTVFNIPFLLYLLYISISSKILPEKLKKIAWKNLSFLFIPYVCFVFIGIFADIFVIRKYTDSTIYLFTILWIIGVSSYRFKSRHSYGFALIFLTFCPFLLYAEMDWVAEKSAVWAYVFLLIGVLHSTIELKAAESPLVKSFFLKVGDTLAIIPTTGDYIIHKGVEIRDFSFFSIRNFFISVIVFIFICTTFFFAVDLTLKGISYRDRQLKNPSVPHIEPTLLYPGTKVLLYGDRFGDNSNSKYALMKDGERVRVDYWEDHKVIFTVPLSWKPGDMNMWIEKPIVWNAETIVERTKPVTIKLLKVTNQFTPDDDKYFDQKKLWRKETKELNGYK